MKRTEVFAGGALSGRRVGTADLTFSERPQPLLADLDGDGDREVVAMFYPGDNRGEIRVFSELALDGRVVDRAEGALWAGDQAGRMHLASPGDLSGDGADDLVIAEPLALSADGTPRPPRPPRSAPTACGAA